MAGTLSFGCGSADQEIELWQLMLHRPQTRIVYWPFALPADLDPGLTDLGGLGLLSGWAILPHFTDDQLDDAAGWAADHRRPVLGLPESVGLRCEDSRSTVVGSGQLTAITVDGLQEFPAGAILDLARQ